MANGFPRVTLVPTNIKRVTTAVPAVGAEIIQTVPLGKSWRLVTFYATLTASSAVANRVPTLVIDDGTNTLMRLNTATSITASQSMGFAAAVIGALAPVLSTIQTQTVALPDASVFALQPGWRVRTLTVAMDAGDQWGAGYLVVDEIDVPYPA